MSLVIREVKAVDVGKVIDLMLQGMTLKAIFTTIGIRPEKFFKAVFADPMLTERYNLAQEARAEILADEIMEIADNTADSQRARNMIDARKWYAGKIRPAKYGDKIDVNVVHNIDLIGAIRDAKARIGNRPIHDPHNTKVVDIVDITGNSDAARTGYTPDDSLSLDYLLS